jgi:hypothetical protein
MGVETGNRATVSGRAFFVSEKAVSDQLTRKKRYF